MQKMEIQWKELMRKARVLYVFGFKKYSNTNIPETLQLSKHKRCITKVPCKKKAAKFQPQKPDKILVEKSHII